MTESESERERGKEGKRRREEGEWEINLKMLPCWLWRWRGHKPTMQAASRHWKSRKWILPWGFQKKCSPSPGSVSQSVQLLSCVRLFATPWIAARQASLSITNCQSSLKLTSIESVMPSSHLILCRPLLLLPPIPPSIRVFSNESTLTWGGQSFSFSIIPSKEYPGLISFRMKWSEVKSLSHARLFATPWTVAYKAPLSMEFSRQEYWSGLPFLSPGLVQLLSHMVTYA